jgi:hypothetical protein
MGVFDTKPPVAYTLFGNLGQSEHPLVTLIDRSIIRDLKFCPWYFSLCIPVVMRNFVTANIDLK